MSQVLYRPLPTSAEEVNVVVQLTVLKARADGFGPDDWQVMEALHQWALRLTQEARLRWLAHLAARTDAPIPASEEAVGHDGSGS